MASALFLDTGYLIALKENFIRSMIKSDGSLLGFFNRPIAAGLGMLTIVVWFWPLLGLLVRGWLTRKR